MSAGAGDATRTFHGTIREDAQPGDEVTLDDGQLRAYDTPSSEGNSHCWLVCLSSNFHSLPVTAIFPRQYLASIFLYTPCLRKNCARCNRFSMLLWSHSDFLSRRMRYPVWIRCCKLPKYDFCISQGSVATVLRWDGQNYSQLGYSYFVMLHTKNY